MAYFCPGMGPTIPGAIGVRISAYVNPWSSYALPVHARPGARAACVSAARATSSGLTMPSVSYLVVCVVTRLARSSADETLDSASSADAADAADAIAVHRTVPVVSSYASTSPSFAVVVDAAGSTMVRVIGASTSFSSASSSAGLTPPSDTSAVSSVRRRAPRGNAARETTTRRRSEIDARDSMS